MKLYCGEGVHPFRSGLNSHRSTQGIFDTAVKELARRWEATEPILVAQGGEPKNHVNRISAVQCGRPGARYQFTGLSNESDEPEINSSAVSFSLGVR